MGFPQNPTGYRRDIVTNKGTYFNGPSTLFIEQDLSAGLIGIYDSTLPFTLENGEPNPAIWLTIDDLKRISDEAPDPIEEEAEEESTIEPIPDTESHTEQSVA